jgi:hypothetical protein
VSENVRRREPEDEARTRHRRESPAARAQRGTSAPVPPIPGTAVDVIALQQAIGNHAVAALIAAAPGTARHAPAGPARLARMTVTAPVANGTFSNVTVSSRAGTGYAQGQGSHTTAYVTFVDMIKLRVVGQTPAQAAHNLVDLHAELLTLPGVAVNNANAIYAQAQSFIATQAALGNPNRLTIETAISKLLKWRNAIPLSRTDYGSRFGRNETWHKYLLEMERRARSPQHNQAAHRYYANRYEILWEMFDLQPTTGVDNAEITNTILQHILSMQATYEELFAQGDLTIAGAAQHFVNTPALWNRFVQKMTTTTTAYPSIAQKQQDLRNEILSW